MCGGEVQGPHGWLLGVETIQETHILNLKEQENETNDDII